MSIPLSHSLGTDIFFVKTSLGTKLSQTNRSDNESRQDLWFKMATLYIAIDSIYVVITLINIDAYKSITTNVLVFWKKSLNNIVFVTFNKQFNSSGLHICGYLDQWLFIYVWFIHQQQSGASHTK